MNKTYYLYILRCKDNSLYTGTAFDLEERIKKHNKGNGGKYTRSHKPVQLAYYEEYPDLSSARRRENEIKDWRKKKKENLIKGFPLNSC